MEKTSVLKHRIKTRIEEINKLTFLIGCEDVGEYELAIIRTKICRLLSEINISLNKIQD